MASDWYPLGLLHAMKNEITGGLDNPTGGLKAALVESTYTYDAADEIIGDVSPIAAAGVALTTVSLDNIAGVLKLTADPVTWTSVAAGAACNKVVVYWESGVAETRYLLSCDELAVAVTPDGNNINLTWGADGVAKITT
jgi:hypothetical protein